MNSNEKILIGFDHANFQNKTENTCFKSGIKKCDSEPFSMKETVFWDGGYYVCGLDNNTDLAQQKYKDDNYFVMTLAGIAKEIEFNNYDRDINIILCAGLPIVNATNKEEKEKFAKYLKRGKVAFKFEGRSYVVNISEVYIFPQGYSAVAPQLDRIISDFKLETGESNPEIFVNDIGGWTNDIFKLVGKIPQPGSMKNIPGFGTNALFSSCKEAVEAKFNIILESSQIEDILVRDIKSKKISVDVYETVYKTAYTHFNEMLNAMSSLGFSREHSNILFVGGGAIILNNVNDYYKNFNLKWSRIISGGIHLNARGYVWIVDNLKKAGKI